MKIERVHDKGIFHLEFQHRYDAAMHFIRYQEFYESTNPEFRGRAFTLLDFLEWYAKEGPYAGKWKRADRTGPDGGAIMSYCADWEGFNVPSWVLDELMPRPGHLTDPIRDLNRYDRAMRHVVGLIREQGHDEFYLIGTSDDSQDGTLDHEISHGLWYLDSDYRTTAKAVLATLGRAVDPLVAWLRTNGYTQEVWSDECVAYLATGLPDHLVDSDLELHRAPFIELLERSK